MMFDDDLLVVMHNFRNFHNKSWYITHGYTGFASGSGFSSPWGGLIL